MISALTIAGSDSSCGAGIQADLKTFAAHQVYGLSVITAITAQNTMGVNYVQPVDAYTVRKQLESIVEDIKIQAIKIGMLYSEMIIKEVVAFLKQNKLTNIVLDPVMVSSSGRKLLEKNGIDATKETLVPLVDLLTPNLDEAVCLTQGNKGIVTLEDAKEIATEIYGLGCKNVLIKGGHFKGDATDVLYNGVKYSYISHKRIINKHTHGTGCTLSSAITANLAKGQPMEEAIFNAKQYITKAIEEGINLGHGIGPLHHFHEFYNKDVFYE